MLGLENNKQCHTQYYGVSLYRTHLMNKHIDGGFEWDTVFVGHGQEPEPHPYVEPFAHAATVEGA